jgi:hypothetical protein
MYHYDKGDFRDFHRGWTIFRFGDGWDAVPVVRLTPPNNPDDAFASSVRGNDKDDLKAKIDEYEDSHDNQSEVGYWQWWLDKCQELIAQKHDTFHEFMRANKELKRLAGRDNTFPEVIIAIVLERVARVIEDLKACKTTPEG